MAIPKSTLVKWVDGLGKEWQGDFGRLVFLSISGDTTLPLLPYIYKFVYKLFNQNPLLWKFFIIFVCWMFCIRKKNLAIVRSCQNACILLHCKTKNKTKLSNFALRYDKRKTNRRKLHQAIVRFEVLISSRYLRQKNSGA